MKPWMKVLIVTLLVGLPTVPLSQILWPSPAAVDMSAAPTSLQLGLLIVLSLCEGLAFGLGVAFLLFGLPLVRRVTGEAPLLTWATYASIAWWLVSWWSHDNFHRVNGDLGGLIMIEYGYHITLMLASAIVALAFVRLFSRAGAEPEARAALIPTTHPEAAVR